MFSHELAIEQRVAAHPHSRDQPRHCNLRCIGDARKHAFAKICPAHCKAIEPADQLSVAPAFHAVRQTHAVQFDEGVFNIVVDPRFLPVLDAFGATADDSGKIAVGRNFKAVLPDRLCQGFGNVELVERQNGPVLRLYPKGLLVLTRVCHRKNAVGICV
jgi:hypothetical protein